MGDPARRVTLLPGAFFVSQVNGSPSFIRKFRKRWFDQGSWGRPESDPSTSFLHIETPENTSEIDVNTHLLE